MEGGEGKERMRGAWSSSRSPVSCACCGQRWPRDPSLEVPCPTCKARVGAWCRRPSGHKAMDLHADRERAAMAAGKLHPCPSAEARPKAKVPLAVLRARVVAALKHSPACATLH